MGYGLCEYAFAKESGRLFGRVREADRGPRADITAWKDEITGIYPSTLCIEGGPAADHVDIENQLTTHPLTLSRLSLLVQPS